MSAVVTTDGLTKDFGTLRAVDDVSLEVEPGEVFGFLGPNGAGKSTTIRLMLGQLQPTAGSATVLGRPPADPESRRRVGYIPGDLALDPKLTGAEHLNLFAALRGGVDSNYIDTLCERFSLDPSRKLATLSKGNRQKIGVVQAFMGEPDLLVLDEPTSGLDPIQQASFQALLAEATDRGAGVVLSSHVLPEVERVADRIGIIRAGRIVSIDTVEELRRAARQRLSFHLAQPPTGFNLDAVDSVKAWNLDGATVEVTLKGPAQPVLNALAGHTVIRISSDDDDLEQLFLHLYEGDEHGGSEQ